MPYRIGVAVVGGAVVLGGLALIPFPGPGWLIVIAGLGILATEFAWARSLLEVVRGWVAAWTQWTLRQSGWLRVVIGLGAALFVYGVLVVSLHLAGVPSWIPEWVPLWR